MRVFLRGFVYETVKEYAKAQGKTVSELDLNAGRDEGPIAEECGAMCEIKGVE